MASRDSVTLASLEEIRDLSSHSAIVKIHYLRKDFSGVGYELIIKMAGEVGDLMEVTEVGEVRMYTHQLGIGGGKAK
jgi:hypothetical protein